MLPSLTSDFIEFKFYLRTNDLHGPILCFAHTEKNLNIKREKSEQSVFAQISLSQY